MFAPLSQNTRLKSHSRLLGLCGLLCLLAASVTPASATTILATDMDWSRAMSTYIFEGGKGEASAWAGAIQILIDDKYSRIAFCVDYFTDIYIGTHYNTDIEFTNNIPNGGRAAWLVNNIFPTITTPAQGAGLQFAIWDVIHDGGDGFSSGLIQAAVINPTDPAIISAANSFLALSVGKSSTAWVYFNTSMSDGSPAQTLMGPAVFDDGPPAVPEPASFALVGCGIGLLAWRARRRRSS